MLWLLPKVYYLVFLKITLFPGNVGRTVKGEEREICQNVGNIKQNCIEACIFKRICNRSR
jgi:hypothetical protein